LTLDQFFWVLGRVAGLGSFAALSISLVTGVALRSGLFGGLAKNRSLKSTHEFTAVLWIPLGLLLDKLDLHDVLTEPWAIVHVALDKDHRLYPDTL